MTMITVTMMIVMTLIGMMTVTLMTVMIIEMFKNSTHCAREYEVERVQLELLDLGQELLRLRCQVDFKEIFVIMLMLILIVIIIVIVIVAILSMCEDVNIHRWRSLSEVDQQVWRVLSLRTSRRS